MKRSGLPAWRGDIKASASAAHGMKCPRCHGRRSCVIDSRSRGVGVLRRRQCMICDLRFSTEETPVEDGRDLAGCWVI